MTKPENVKPHVLLCVTGSIQADAVPRLVANLIKHPEIGEHEVIVVGTHPALDFFDRDDVEKKTGRKVFVTHGDGTEEFPVPHIHLAEWADLVIVYPATANTIAKCANGFTESLVSNVVLTAECPVFFGAIMNKKMYEKPATQRNLKLLEENGYYLLPRKVCDVVVKSTGKVEKKLYCSETMVLAAVQKMLHDDDEDLNELDELAKMEPNTV